MKLLLRTFLDGHFEPDEFVDLFFTQASVLRDLVWSIIKTHPTFGPISQAFKERKIGVQEFEAQQSNFLASLDETQRTLIDADRPLSHLWVDADAYRSDPDEREPGLHIGDDELRQVVEETLAILER
jgi:hypothetical protein